MSKPLIKDVLIFTPQYRLEPETVLALMNMEWDGALSILIQRDNPGTDAKANHLHQYQRGRETFLKGRYDAMLVIESDIIPPADALKRLAALNADLAYGVYRFRGKANVINIFEKYPPKNGKPARNVGSSLSCEPGKLKRAVRQGKVDCSGGGLGIVLIRRNVLEQIEFRMEEGPLGFCDTPFTDDVHAARFTQIADMAVACGHKDINGVVLWPDLPSPR